MCVSLENFQIIQIPHSFVLYELLKIYGGAVGTSTNELIFMPPIFSFLKQIKKHVNYT